MSSPPGAGTAPRREAVWALGGGMGARTLEGRVGVGGFLGNNERPGREAGLKGLACLFC